MPKSKAFFKPYLETRNVSVSSRIGWISHRHIPDSVVNVDLPLSGRDASGFGIPNGVDTSVQVTLSSGEFVSSNCLGQSQRAERHGKFRKSLTTDDGALRSVLGEQSRGGTTVPSSPLDSSTSFRMERLCSPGRQDDDGTSVLFKGSGNTGQRQRFRGLGRSRSELPQLIELGRVADGGFRKESGLGHHSDGFEGVVALGGFTGQHDTVSTVENGVSDVRDFSSGGSRVILKQGN